MVRADSVTAESAGLRYVTDALPGITRERGGGWVYRRPDGSIITDPDERAWIDVIGIPPALDFGSARGRRAHLATGRGSRGRRQYRYHPRWQQVRDQSKYNRVAGFAGALPGLRRRIERDLGLPGLPREEVLGAVFRLMDLTLIRIGNEEYARQNEHYGLTTLRHDRVRFQGCSRWRGPFGRRGATKPPTSASASRPRTGVTSPAWSSASIH